jgi:hypothetical protein
MTREEVTALSDEELRTIAALHMGWENVTNSFGRLWGYKRCANSSVTSGVPHYTDDIAAAWELVIAMEEHIANVFHLERDWHSGKWYATFSWIDEDSGGNIRSDPWFSSVGDTAPQAITRAFVLAMSNGPHAN